MSDNPTKYRFSRNLIIYFLGSVFTKLISFFLLPLYTRKLEPSVYGYYDLIITFIDISLSIIFIEIWQGILRFSIGEDNLDNKNRVISNFLLIYIPSLIIYLVVFIIVSRSVELKYPLLLFLLGIITSLMYLCNFLARGYQRNLVFVIAGISNGLISVVLNLIFILGLGMNLDALLISACSANLISILIIIFALRNTIKIKISYIDFGSIKKYVFFCAPLVINTISFWFLTSFNRIVVLNKLGIEFNGLYAVANKFATALSLFTSVFLLSWQETAFILSQDIERGKYYSSMLNKFTFFLIEGAMVLIPITFLVYPVFVGSAYSQSKAILPLFYGGTIASATSNFLAHIFGAEKKTGVIFTSTLFGAIVSILTVTLTIRYIGLFAAALSILTGYLVTIATRYFIIRKHIMIRFEYKKLLVDAGLYALATFSFYKLGFRENLVICIILVGYWLFSSRSLIFVLLQPVRDFVFRNR
jgi:O-antigen/teichoic acid export membrane protein